MISIFQTGVHDSSVLNINVAVELNIKKATGTTFFLPV
jgi:hypothetical protein